jgi:hypothetical protein
MKALAFVPSVSAVMIACTLQFVMPYFVAGILILDKVQPLFTNILVAHYDAISMSLVVTAAAGTIISLRKERLLALVLSLYVTMLTVLTFVCVFGLAAGTWIVPMK